MRDMSLGAFVVRQCRGRCIHLEGRRDAIVQVDHACDSPPEILRPDEYHIGPGVHSRISQHPIRRSVVCGTDPADRVVDPSAAAGSSVHQLGDTLDRFVCDLREQEATNIRITIPGHEGQIRGRHASSVDGNGNGVRLPTIQDAAGGLEQNTEIPRSVCHSHSTTNTVSVVDVRPAPDVSGVPNATGTGRASYSRARGSTSRRGQQNQTLPALKSSRLETLRAILMNKGHSRRAAEVMTQYLRESSQIVYEGHWKRFVTYCQNKGLNIFNVRSRHFSSYCLDLFDNGFQPGTIISHRTPIASVLRHWKYDPANDPHITLLQLLNSKTSGASHDARMGSPCGLVPFAEAPICWWWSGW